MTTPTHPRRIPHDRGRHLRREQTDAEAKLWSRLRRGQLQGLQFRRQFPIGNFIADFCCPLRRLVIELDGGQHLERAGYDTWRTRLISERGYRVIRFWDHEVLLNTDEVINAILLALCESLD
jgi:very-short-patch-repair endonuclease